MHLLFVANFPSGTGYAWGTIEAVYRAVGERLVRDGHRVSVCYAALGSAPPPGMSGAPFEVFAFDFSTTAGLRGALRFARVLRERGVSALYLTDQPTWSVRYLLFRLAGVRRITIHDRTSGERAPRGPLARALKRAVHRVPGLAGDVFIGVSEYVRRRLLRVNGTPPERTFRVYNGIPLGRFLCRDRRALHRLLGIAPGTPVVLCSGRAQAYKGVQVVVEAAARLWEEGDRDVAFVHCGDGPALPWLRERAAGLGNFHFLGKRSDVPELLCSATLAVVPSLWEEAFGLAVVEAMAAGVPVIATRTGGIPELVEDGRTGVLVEPGDAAALAGAVRRLLGSPADRGGMAARAREEVRARFGIGTTAAMLYTLVSAQAAPGPLLSATPGGPDGERRGLPLPSPDLPG